MSAQHTPTPWQLDPCHSANGFRAIRRADGSEHGDTDAPVIATAYTGPDAKFIVRAVNSHDALVAAVARAVEMCGYALNRFNWGASALDAKAIGLLNEVPGELRKALAAARGEG